MLLLSCQYILRLYKCKIVLSRQYNNVNIKIWFKVKNEQRNRKKIGANIRNIRESVGMTQETLSAKLQLCGCDITRSALAKIEVGQRHLYPDEIILIKEILKTDFDEIFRL